MKKSASYLSLDAAFKILLLLGFAAFFIGSVLTGTVALYVHKRMIPFILFAAGVMIVIAVLLTGRLFFQDGVKSKSRALLFFAVPLVLALVLPAKAFDSASGVGGDLQLSAGDYSAFGSVSSESQSDLPAASGNSDISAVSSESGSSQTEEKGLTYKDGVLIVDGNNYYQCMTYLYADLDQYVGTKIQMDGFVWKDSEKMTEEEFVPARMMMVCCAADMVTVGLLCRYDKTSQLAADSWVTVTGVVDKAEFEGEIIPCITVETAEETERPAQEYIYPYY